MLSLLSTARAALLLAAFLAPTPYRAPEPPPVPACGAVVAEDDNTVCWDYAVLYNLRTGAKLQPLFGKPDASTLTMLQSGNYGIAVTTHCEAGE